jgi:hypothetical protein
MNPGTGLRAAMAAGVAAGLVLASGIGVISTAVAVPGIRQVAQIAVHRDQSPNLTGHWESAQGAVDLVQRGSAVTGGGPSGVRISGTLSGTTFTFRFWEGASYATADPEDRGRGTATYDSTTNTLVGSWRTEKSGAKYNGGFELHRVSDITGPANQGAADPAPHPPAATPAGPGEAAALGTVTGTSQFIGSLVGALAGASTAVTTAAATGVPGAAAATPLPGADPALQDAQTAVDVLSNKVEALNAQVAAERAELADAQNWVANLEVFLKLARQNAERAAAEAQRTSQVSQRLTAELTALQDAAAASDDPGFYAARIDDLATRWTIAWSTHTKARMSMYSTMANLAAHESLMGEAQAEVNRASEAFATAAQAVPNAVHQLTDAVTTLVQLQNGAQPTK